MNGEHGQTSQEVARVIVNVAILGSDEKKRSFTGINDSNFKNIKGEKLFITLLL